MTDRVDAPDELRHVEAFLNTLDVRTCTVGGQLHVPADHLSTPGELRDWLILRRLVTLGRRVTRSDLTRALELRAALRQVLAAGAEQLSASRRRQEMLDQVASDRAELQAANDVLSAWPLALRVQPDGSLELQGSSGSALDALVASVGRSLSDGTWHRLRMCAADDCHWIFYDSSRNGAGRWCSMDTCGNRMKTRRYRVAHAKRGRALSASSSTVRA